MKQDQKIAVLNPSGKIEIIEFFDYNCIHCKREYKVIEELIKLRKDIRVVLRPIPILGKESMNATQIGNVILFLDPAKYLKYLTSIMKDFGTSSDPIHDAIKASGVSVEIIKNTLENNSKEIREMIKRDADLADKYGVQGTPAFVINGEVLEGETSLEELNRRT